MTESVPTPAPDLRERVAEAISARWSADEAVPRSINAERLATAALEVVEPELARLREEAAEWKRAAEAEAQGRTTDVMLMVRDLNAALFDGSTLLPDRPLDTVWKYLLGLVREDAASRSGRGEVPDDAGYRIVAKIVTRLIQAGVPLDQHQQNFLPQIVKDEMAGWGAVTNPTDGEAGRTITVCGAVDQLDAGLFCILPPEHVKHTTRDNGVTWHKAVTATGSGMEFATTPPGYEPPKLSDLAGLFTPADTAHLCSAHWVRYIRGSDWWDEACESCDHVKAREVLGDEVPAGPVVPAPTEDPWRMAEWNELPDVCFIQGCESLDADQRGPIFLRDGSIHKACQDHWEPIHRVLGEQAGSDDTMRSAPPAVSEEEPDPSRCPDTQPHDGHWWPATTTRDDQTRCPGRLHSAEADADRELREDEQHHATFQPKLAAQPEETPDA